MPIRTAQLLIAIFLAGAMTLTAAPVDVAPIKSHRYEVKYPTSSDVYHVLYRGSSVDKIDRPVAMRLGKGAKEGSMHDSVPFKRQAFYRVKTIPLAEAGDLDGDGLSDLRELSDSEMNPLNPGTVASEHGSPIISTREHFERLAHRDNFPGASDVREVKFLVTGVDTPNPKLYFLNTKRHTYHYYFAVFGLGWQGLDLAEFNRQTYFSNSTRKNIAGSLIAHDNYRAPDGQQGIYALEFWPTDPVSAKHIINTYEQVAASMPFLDGNLAYHPAGETQRELYEEQKAEFDASFIRVISTEELFANQTYGALNPGVGFGKLRVIGAGSDFTYSVRDIVIFRNVPNDLTHVGGIITEVPQTPLSHINLKARQNKTPNAYIKDATKDSRIAPFIGKYVLYEVTSDGFTILPATEEQVNQALESSRPPHWTDPKRDLSAKEIGEIGQIDFAESDSYGAKAANVSELRKILPAAMAPGGYAIPFHYYHQFMLHNGLYDYVARMMYIDGFEKQAELREAELKKLRKKIEKADLPEWMAADFLALQQRFPSDAKIRCRSSTNNEDLPGFNGAGLYDSFTHHPGEGHLGKTIKQVWASLWNYRAFEEREFYRINHFKTAMGVLVHESYDDEFANGVAVTKNIIDPNWTGYYVNVQMGEDLVTNPTEDAIPEEFLVSLLLNDAEFDDYHYEVQYVRKSNRRINGLPILSEEQIFNLAGRMELIQKHFHRLYRGNQKFAMEIEFKVDSRGELVIKQARPWVE